MVVQKKIITSLQNLLMLMVFTLILPYLNISASTTVGGLTVTVLDANVCNSGASGIYASNQQLHVSGRGYTANAKISIFIQTLIDGEKESIPIASSTADDQGVVDEVVTIPLTITNKGIGLLQVSGIGSSGDARILHTMITLVRSATDDRDSDGIADICDNCPDTPSSNQTDTDGDGLGDICDSYPNDHDNDFDKDGMAENIDPCPFDAENDKDGDGICEIIDNCPTIANPGQEDTDFDGVGDVCPNDLIADAGSDQTIDANDLVVLNGSRSRPTSLTYIWNQVDGASVTLDISNPKYPTFTAPSVEEQTTLIFQLVVNDGINASEPDAVSIIVIPTAVIDSDSDGIPDDSDNCPTTINPDQIDTDGDGIGDACDAIVGDLDGDGDVDLDDNNIILAARNSPATGPDDPRDLDGDGMITAYDSRKLVLLCTRPRCATQ